MEARGRVLRKLQYSLFMLRLHPVDREILSCTVRLVHLKMSHFGQKISAIFCYILSISKPNSLLGAPSSQIINSPFLSSHFNDFDEMVSYIVPGQWQ